MSSADQKLLSYEYSPYQFSAFRIVLGVYLVQHFAYLVPYSAELFSNAGVLPDPSVLPSWGAFPNIFFLVGSANGAMAIMAFLTLLSALFALGIARRPVALLLWYGWACLVGRNPFISNPGLPFIGLLLLLCAVIPTGEPWSLGKGQKREPWSLPPFVFAGFWALMAIAYTLSGIHKMESPSWADGTAMLHLINNPLSRDNFVRDLMLLLPLTIIQLKTWGVLALEVLFAPLCIFAWTRKWAWLAMVAMHFGILSVVDFADLTWGVLMAHIFTFDQRWVPARSPRGNESPIIYFDGVCGLCNRFVQFVLDEDKPGRFRFATQQAYSDHLPKEFAGELSTVIVRTDDGTFLAHSAAVIHVLNRLGGMWRLLGEVLWLVPAPIRDWGYALIARYRYRIFGQSEACRMPTPAERKRFLAAPAEHG
jgi:predicted DCC family thiol-disulfide oxidoreductase YuxK